MNARIVVISISSALCLALFLADHLVAQDPPPTPPALTQSAGQNSGAQQGLGRGGERRPGLFGKISAIHDQSVEISTMEGATVTAKITADTQFRKGRDAAKLADFKVGDMVFVRGEENADHTWTAQLLGARPNGSLGGGPGPGGAEGARGGPGGQFMQQMGVLGQDYIVGEIKSVDAPKLTILRPDDVTQSIELNEETSLRKGRDSITMADIQTGDHVFVRGGMANNVFQPKNVMVFSPEQWKRMQEMGIGGPGAPAPKPPQDNKPQNPTEPRL
jgi:preprotein translocase subunit YajC